MVTRVVTCYACGHQIGRGGYRWERVGDVEAPRCRSAECTARTGWPFLANCRKPAPTQPFLDKQE